VPEVAARAHVELIEPVARAALAEAGLTLAEIAGIAATAGPGLVGAVMVGLSFGKGLALAAGKPLIAVNHLEGHAVSARLEADCPIRSCCCWFRAAIASCWTWPASAHCGGLGSTIDDAAGEAFDKIAKALGLLTRRSGAGAAGRGRRSDTLLRCRALSRDGRAATFPSRG